MPPATAATATATSRYLFSPFRFDELKEMIAHDLESNTESGFVATTVYIKDTIKRNGETFYYIRSDSKMLDSMTQKDFWLLLLSLKEYKKVIEKALEHFTTTYSPILPPVENTLRVLNLFEFSAFTGRVGPRREEISNKIVALMQLLCGSDQSLCDYVAWWFWAVLNGQTPDTALVISGDQGTGKSTLAYLFYSLVPPRLRTTARAEQFERFNSTFRGRSFVYCDEFKTALTQNQLNSLKLLVSNNEMTFERKGGDPITDTNNASLLIVSNGAIPDLNGRRYCHINPTKRAMDELSLHRFKEFCAECQDPQNNHEIAETFFGMLRDSSQDIDRPPTCPSAYIIEQKTHSSTFGSKPKLYFEDAITEFLSEQLQGCLQQILVAPASASPIFKVEKGSFCREFIKFSTNYKRIHNLEIHGSDAEVKRQFIEYCGYLGIQQYRDSVDKLRINCFVLEFNLSNRIYSNGNGNHLCSFQALKNYSKIQERRLTIFRTKDEVAVDET